jgi:hypothetical protein
MVSVNVPVKVYPQIRNISMANDSPHRQVVPANPLRWVISASYAFSEDHA